MSLPHIIFEFCKYIIIKNENDMFKNIYNTETNLCENNQLIQAYIQISTINYLNYVYKSLILKNNDYLVKYFDNMVSILNHSKICLLHIILNITIAIHLRIDRKNLQLINSNSLDEILNSYINSLINEINKSSDTVIDILTQSISHDCTGIDISTCNPDEDLFYVKNIQVSNK